MNLIRRLTSHIGHFFRGLIPKYIGNRAVLGFMEVLRFIERHRRDRFSHQLSQNRENYIERFDLLEDQLRYRDLQFGRRDISRCGCEIMAAYNALLDLGLLGSLTFPEIIEAFSKDGMLLGGRFGTSPLAIRSFLTRQGFRTRFTSKTSEFCQVADRSRGVILTFFNNRDDVFAQVHTVYISRDSKGWTVHNLHGNGRTDGPYATFEELLAQIKHGRIKGICLTGIL